MLFDESVNNPLGCTYNILYSQKPQATCNIDSV